MDPYCEAVDLYRSKFFTAEFAARPFWGTALPSDNTPTERGALPATADVVVIGGGLTGLTAARVLSNAGRDVVVFDADKAGSAASSRNAGMLGWHSRHSFTGLIDTVGHDAAVRFYRELRQIFDLAVRTITGENIACDFRQHGRFIGATSQASYDELKREYKTRADLLGENTEIVTASRSEIDTDCYHGGVVIRDNASINPALYSRGIRALAEQAGARVFDFHRVTGLTKDTDGFTIQIADKVIRSKDVLVATNGHTTRLTPWLFSRLIPINAYMVATEEIEPGILSTLFPGDRTYVESRGRSNYMQLSKDGKRIIFGGQTGSWPVNIIRVAYTLRQSLVQMFPALENVRISHAWTGRCAATADLFPKFGSHDGVHYALGYCFSGNAMAPYLGMQAANKILGVPVSSAFEARTFPQAAWYTRNDMLISLYMWYLDKSGH
ncbi:NAD(P)/FAD-dependent oxidoreductase [Pseudorhodoplanes sp.]|uniref:NAD(P)/FAD-dependent oxidoreductase n=1 Tax=Pseudorhodoplanes sp. TaxID=1934341 RepID=UPI003D0B6F0A